MADDLFYNSNCSLNGITYKAYLNNRQSLPIFIAFTGNRLSFVVRTSDNKNAGVYNIMIRATLKNGVTYDENFGITLLVIRNETIKNKSNKDAPFFLDTLKN